MAALAACAFFVRHEATSRALRAEIPLGQRIGALTLLGVVEWRAGRPDFGGFSGLELEADGGFIAITDKAHWARARMVLDSMGFLTGVEGLEIGRLDDADGVDLMDEFTDSEALTREADGAFLIGFEDVGRIGRFETLRSPEETLAALPGLADLPANGGLESVLALPDGRIVALAETVSDETGAFPGWIMHGDDVSPFTLPRDSWYMPTDLALGPGGEWVYLLERRFTLIGGFAMRLRRFELATLESGSRLDPDLLAEVVSPPLAENYEGLAATRDADGRTLLYVISDDNFMALQKTLLVQFRVEE